MGQLANNSYIPQTEPKLRVNAVLSRECNLFAGCYSTATSIITFTHSTLCYSNAKIRFQQATMSVTELSGHSIDL